VFTLSEVRFAIDVLPPTVTWQAIYLSDTPIGAGYGLLTPVATRSGFTTKYEAFTLDFLPTAGRYLEVVTNGGGSWTAIGDAYSRVNWVDRSGHAGGLAPTGDSGAVPEPASLSLALAAAGLLGLQRRRSRG
jgi:hypothetical protein